MGKKGAAGCSNRPNQPSKELDPFSCDASKMDARSTSLALQVTFHVFNKEVDYPLGEGETEAVLETEDADHRHQVKVMHCSY